MTSPMTILGPSFIDILYPEYCPPKVVDIPHSQKTHVIAAVLNMIFENCRRMERVMRKRVMARSGSMSDVDEVWNFDHAPVAILGIELSVNGFLNTSSRNIESGHLVIKSLGLTLDAYFTSVGNNVVYAGRQPTVVYLDSNMGLVTGCDISVNTIQGDDELALLMML